MRILTREVTEEYDAARQPDLLPHGLDLRLLFHEHGNLDPGPLGRDGSISSVARSVRHSVFLFLRPRLRRARDFDWRVLAQANHDAAEMQDSAALGCRRRNTRAAACRCSGQMGNAHGCRAASGPGSAFVLAVRSDDGISGWMVAGNSGRRSNRIFTLSRAARFRRAAAREI